MKMHTETEIRVNFQKACRQIDRAAYKSTQWQLAFDLAKTCHQEAAKLGFQI